MTDLTVNDVLAPPKKREYRLGIIQIPALSSSDLISVDKTDTQGKLRDTGVFAELHAKLLLPASYSIFGVFYRMWQNCWEVCVESPDLPVVPQDEEPPALTVTYIRVPHEDVTLLKEIRIEQRWQRTYHPGEVLVEDMLKG